MTGAETGLLCSFLVTKSIAGCPPPKFHVAGSEPGSDRVWLNYQSPLFTAQMMISGIQTDRLEIRCSWSYFQLLRNRLEILYPPGVFATDVLTAWLLTKGFCPIHSGAVTIDGNGIVITGPASVGKTTTVLNLLRELPNARVMSDDIVVTDGLSIFGCPMTASAEYDFPELGIRAFRPWHHFALKLSPLLLPFLANHIAPLCLQLPKDKLAWKAPVQYLFFLERGEPRTERLEAEDALRQLLLINRLEFSYQRDLLLVAYSWAHPDFPIWELMNQETQILSSLIQRAKCFKVSSPAPDGFWKKITEIIK